MIKTELSLEAKHLCRSQHSGVLSTQSSSMEGYPFGSVTPFLMTPEGDPVIYISDLAQHTHNIKKDPKVSLFVFEPHADDSQANGRVTILGEAELYEDAEFAKQYMHFFDSAKSYEEAHDFNFYKINTRRVRYIGGFGKIYWIQEEHWRLPRLEWQQDTSGMVEHMNEDHEDAMQLMVQMLYGKSPAKLEMVAAFQEGVHYKDENNHVYYIPFKHFCQSGQDVRMELVRLTKESRAQVAA